MKLKTFLVFLWAFFYNVNAQQCKFTGIVIDSLGLSVIDASVTAYDSENKNVGYVFTDLDGYFTFELLCNQKYEFEIEHLQYESFIGKVDLDKNKTQKFILKKSNNTLSEIVSIAKVPIKIKGDTIEYDADSFKTGTEETLEDILKKLPGIEVEDGKVYHEGKEITTIKVGGREIFGGNTKLLTKNLPSDVIDKIQLQKKIKKNPFANALQDDEQPELNILLKDDAKNLVFGNTTLGGDADTHWDVQEKLFYFDSTKDATIIGDYNTFGKEVFSREDYFSFLGGVSEFFDEGGNYSLRNSLNNISLNSTENAAELSSAIGAAHFGYEPNKKWYANGFIMGNKNTVLNRTQTERIFNFEDLKIVDNAIDEDEILSALTRFRVDYLPNDRTQYKYRINLNYQDITKDENVNSFINDISASNRKIHQEKENLNISQKLSFIKKIGENNNLGVYLTHQYQNENPEWILNTNEVPFVTINNISQQAGIYNLDQKQKLNINTLQGLVVYNHLLTRTSNLKTKIGANRSRQDFTNQLFSYNTLLNDTGQLTDGKQIFTETYVDFTYSKKFKDLKVEIGAGISNFNIENQFINNAFENKKTEILPHLSFNYEFSAAENLGFRYTREYSFPTVTELNESYTIQNFYSLFNGNNQLRPSLNDNFSLNYGMFKSTSFFHFYTGINYIIIEDAYQIGTDYTGITQINSARNSDKKQSLATGYAGLQKKFSKHYTAQLRANGSYAKSYPFVNGMVSETESINQSYTFNNTFKYAKKIETKLGLVYSRNNYNSTQEALITENLFTTLQPSIDITWSINKMLLFQTEYIYRFQRQNGESLQDNQEWNAALYIKPYKSLSIKLTANNLLNNALLVNNSFNNNITFISEREVLGTYFIASVKYKF